MATSDTRDLVLKAIGDGIRYDASRAKLMLVGRDLRGFKRVSRFLSWAENQHPNRGNWKDPESGLYSYPEARRAS